MQTDAAAGLAEAGTHARWRLARFALISATMLLAGYAAWSFVATLTSPFGQYLGVDAVRYFEHARWWLDRGSPYQPAEVAAPFAYSPGTFLHPPISLPLFLVFGTLPLPLWWMVPLGIIGWSIRRAPVWTWPLLAFVAWWPRTQGALIVGNTDMWVAAFAAAGVRYGWPAVLVVVKPSLIPLALTGIRHRSWWLGGLVVAIVSLAFGTLWWEWLAVLHNGGGDVTYSLLNAPFPVAVTVASIAQRPLPSRFGP